MQLQPNRRSSLFLLELIISILFFSLASAVCVRFFVKSHTLEASSIALEHAVTAATSTAEIIRNQEDSVSAIQTLFPLSDTQESAIFIYYDQDWILCSSTDAVYTLTLRHEYSDSFFIGEIDVSDSDTSIYTLNIKKYRNQEDAVS